MTDFEEDWSEAIETAESHQELEDVAWALLKAYTGLLVKFRATQGLLHASQTFTQDLQKVVRDGACRDVEEVDLED